MGAKESVGQEKDVVDTEHREKGMKACSCDLTDGFCLRPQRENIKIIPIKLSEEERRHRRKEILKALIREGNV
jgi:hypothetical protein